MWECQSAVEELLLPGSVRCSVGSLRAEGVLLGPTLLTLERGAASVLLLTGSPMPRHRKGSRGNDPCLQLLLPRDGAQAYASVTRGSRRGPGVDTDVEEGWGGFREDASQSFTQTEKWSSQKVPRNKKG